MKTLFHLIRYASAVLTLAFAVPAFALAATTQTDRTIVYSTSMQPLNNSIAYPFNGSLHIRTSKDGTVTGFFRRDYEFTQFTPVTGSIQNGNVWLVIGTHSTTTITGKYADGRIVGSASGPDGVFNFAASATQLQ